MWIYIFIFKEAQEQNKNNLQQFVTYALSCLSKYDLFSEGLTDLKVPTSSIGKSIIFEVVLQFLFWIQMGTVFVIKKYGGIDSIKDGLMRMAETGSLRAKNY